MGLKYSRYQAKITTDWKSVNFYNPRLRNGKNKMVKYLYVEITIVNNDVLVLWRLREQARC